MRIVHFDDCHFPWGDIEGADWRQTGLDLGRDNHLDNWFYILAQKEKWFAEPRVDAESARSAAGHEDGVFVIHANACFTAGTSRQSLEGIEVLKHIRLTDGLRVRRWHAIIYSFESLEDILSRKPGDLILTSRGVTFLQLPSALDLRQALMTAYPQKPWTLFSLNDILEVLAREVPADPDDHSFRTFVAADYTPPDSPHRISNLWGIYEMYLALSNTEHGEYSMPALLPSGVREFVLRLDTKKARWLEASGASSSPPKEPAQPFDAALERLTSNAERKTIVYVDDEAEKGWLDVLKRLLNRSSDAPRCRIVVPTPIQLRLPDKTTNWNSYTLSVQRLAQWTHERRPSLLILDLRLLGADEAYQDPNHASGMDVAREVRRRDPYLSILLFTASNKAETLLISRSLDVDDYWMKPGLGEHRGLSSCRDSLLVLADKLNILLGDDSSWLQRVSHEVSVLRDRPKPYHWWEHSIKWPNPSYAVDPNKSPPPGHSVDPTKSDVQPRDDKVRERVLAYLNSILYTARLVFKMKREYGQLPDATADAVHLQYTPPESVPGLLGAALFNQIGQVVEIVHGLSKDSDPFRHKSSNGRVGGYYDKPNFIFRRCDWWAFSLFSLRNKFSHPGSNANLDEVKRAVSDLIAWLTTSRIKVRPIRADLRRAIAAEMLRNPLENGGFYPVMHLLLDETHSPVYFGNKRVPSETPGNETAQDSRFRGQLAMRPEFAPLVEKSRLLLSGPEAT